MLPYIDATLLTKIIWLNNAIETPPNINKQTTEHRKDYIRHLQLSRTTMHQSKGNRVDGLQMNDLRIRTSYKHTCHAHT